MGFWASMNIVGVAAECSHGKGDGAVGFFCGYAKRGKFRLSPFSSLFSPRPPPFSPTPFSPTKHVIGHQAVGQDADSGIGEILLDEVEVDFAILLKEEDTLAVYAALRDVVRHAGLPPRLQFDVTGELLGLTTWSRDRCCVLVGPR